MSPRPSRRVRRHPRAAFRRHPFGETDWHSRWVPSFGLRIAIAAARVPCRRRGAHPLDRGRARHELLHAGRLESRPEARVRARRVLRPSICSTATSVERQPIGGQVIGAASAIHELFMAGRNSGPGGARPTARQWFPADLVGKVSGLAYHYRTKERAPAISGCSRRSHAECATPDRLGRRVVYGFAAPHFVHVADRSAGGDASLERWSDAIASRYRGRVEAHVVPQAPAELIGTGGARCYLVRPDGYVAATAPAAERAAIESSLAGSLL